MAVVTVSSKGQLVIPAAIRKILGIKPHSKVRITLSEDQSRLVLEPLPANPIDTLTGIFQEHPHSLADELLRERQRDLGKEEA